MGYKISTFADDVEPVVDVVRPKSEIAFPKIVERGLPEPRIKPPFCTECDRENSTGAVGGGNDPGSGFSIAEGKFVHDACQRFVGDVEVA